MAYKIEVGLCKPSKSTEHIEDLITDLLERRKCQPNSLIRIPSKLFPELDLFENEIHSISFNQIPKDSENLKKEKLVFFFFEFNEQGPEVESLETHESEHVAASIHWMLPNKADGFLGLWESLIFDKNVKEDLLNFASTMLLFSKKEIDQNIISCNRLILLHGVPGTGKTSLAKALSQKLSIHMKKTYEITHLFEINSHSLFSKWFSESGKLVLKMFEQILEVVENESNLVCVLIDEVESLVVARENISTSEPTDSVRVVNSVLTQLDRIKKFPNVLVITTSNLLSNIDSAFIDRADIVVNLPEPSPAAIFEIVVSVIHELVLKGLIVRQSSEEQNDFSLDTISSFNYKKTTKDPLENSIIISAICEKASGFSGRALRKLPFLAFALYLKKDTAILKEFLLAMISAVMYQQKSKKIFKQNDSKLALNNGDLNAEKSN